MKLKVLVDTNIIIGKRNALFNLLKNYDLIFSDLVVAEVMEVIRENVLESMKKNKSEVANKYLAFGREFLKMLYQLNVQLEYPNIKDFIEAFEVMHNRDVDAVDAVLAVIAKRQGVSVLSNDKDWDRLKDYANRVSV
ncbi:type II toxin-antitoxin system VapC family toxin [Saccharolobus caldissimus]|uniref:DNA-binding protein n=1 Tax=Saccharolobus caldissimus TaxID=1702097 RepID=A0AAQ4CVG0_9CREN|nr:PIN domain-containing protein [Saccharolobus caldissimus]BDB99791.1 DNA-binding protein [Saccharolobus caldissimus]